MDPIDTVCDTLLVFYFFFLQAFLLLILEYLLCLFDL